MKAITQFFRRLINSDAPTQPKARIYTRSEHCISRDNISPSALKVLYRLHNAGYQAYLVGGGVRDLLLGYSPKDFDVATDATPEQVKKLFRNCRLIGRRFRLAHVVFGREIIEVATFRGHHGENDNEGMVRRDNVFGTLEEDASRRDFTVNALYYNIADFSVVDFLGGMNDLKHRTMHIIGDPKTRYREDPVRMLRAIRLSTKLGLRLAESTAEPIESMAELLQQVSNARLWDECGKMFLAGHASTTWHRLRESNLARQLFPATKKSLRGERATEFRHFIDRATGSTDARIKQGKPVTPAFLFAVLLWPPLVARFEQLKQHCRQPSEAFIRASGQVLNEQHKHIAIPKRFSAVIREIWQLQSQLGKRQGLRAERLIGHPRFRAAYDFLVLRAEPNSAEETLANWWTDYQQADADTRAHMVHALGKSGRTRRRRHSSSPKPAHDA